MVSSKEGRMPDHRSRRKDIAHFASIIPPFAETLKTDGPHTGNHPLLSLFAATSSTIRSSRLPHFAVYPSQRPLTSRDQI